MTDDELDANLAKIQDLQRRTNLGIHELLNILAVIKGEIDLAADRARSAIEKFYDRYPEFKDL